MNLRLLICQAVTFKECRKNIYAILWEMPYCGFLGEKVVDTIDKTARKGYNVR
jgi:hypothetical protein